MKKFKAGAVDIIAKAIKAKNPDLEIFLGNKLQTLNDIDPHKLAQMGLDWGKLSQQGLVCGILGCNSELDIRCNYCGGHYCKEHKAWHHHGEDHDGIIEIDSSEL